MGWWDDLRIAGSARTTGANAAGKELFFGAQLPHRYQIGAPLKPHVHWLADTTETYTGTWTLDYLWANPTQATPISNKITLSAGSGIFLLEFDFHHESDSLGSVAEYTK